MGLRLIRRIVETMESMTAHLSSGIIIVIMVLITADVAYRTVTGGSIGGILEINEVALTIVVFLALPETQRQRAHVAVDVLAARLGSRGRAAVTIFGYSVSVVIVSWMIYATGQRAVSSFQVGETRFGFRDVPVWPARWVITIGSALLVVSLLVSIWQEIGNFRGRHQPGEAEPDSLRAI